MQQSKGPQKSMLVFLAIGMLLVLMMNALVPRLTQVQEVPYSEFLQMLQEGRVTQVQQDATGAEIQFLANDDKGRAVYYVTGAMTDVDLSALLQQYKTADGESIVFGRELPAKNNSLMTLVFSWLLPMGSSRSPRSRMRASVRSRS